MKNSENQREQSAVTTGALTWPPTATLDDGNLLIAFQGLLSFCYNAKGECEVGAYSKSDRHKLQIRIRGGAYDDLLTVGDGPDDIKRVGTSIFQVGGSMGQPVKFYMPGASFDRLDDPDHKDFRWLLDLEGPDFYGKAMGKKSGFYSTKLLIRNGTFYTLDLTCSTFKRIDQETGKEKKLGRMPFYMGAIIRLTADATLNLKTVSGFKQFTFDHTSEYVIVVSNNCSDNGAACTSNDFFHHFASLKPTATDKPFAIDADVPVYQCHHEHDGLFVDFIPTSTDPAPCGSAGYGHSGGTP